MQCTRTTDGEHCKVNGTQYDDINKAFKSSEKSINIVQAIAHSAFGK